MGVLTMKKFAIVLVGLIVATVFLLACQDDPPEPRLSATGDEDMVLVPAGYFVMGADSAVIDAAPRHRVWVDSFWIDRHEVTNAQYKEFIDATGYPPPALDEKKYPWAKPFNWVNNIYPEGAGDKPVVLISWDDAAAYAAWRGCRLPTEAEWEKAARGIDGRIYPWGNQWDSTRVWCRLNSFYGPKGKADKIADVSPYGVINMAGNVAEWCFDFYDKDYYKNSPERNPFGPDAGSRKVVRGGSWQNADKNKFTVFYRDAQFSSTKTAAIGFRCVKVR